MVVGASDIHLRLCINVLMHLWPISHSSCIFGDVYLRSNLSRNQSFFPVQGISRQPLQRTTFGLSSVQLSLQVSHQHGEQKPTLSCACRLVLTAAAVTAVSFVKSPSVAVQKLHTCFGKLDTESKQICQEGFASSPALLWAGLLQASPGLDGL